MTARPRLKSFQFAELLTGDGALGSSGDIDAGGRSQAGSDEAGGHCESW